jgi:hypothetical protein
MLKIRSVTAVSATLSLTAGAVHLATHVFGWPLSHELLQVITILAAFIAVLSYYTKVATDQVSETAEEVRTEITRTITEEHKILHRAIVTEIESYGQQRTIDAHVAAERRRVAEQQAGQETTDLHGPPGPRRRNNVTPLLRNQG